MRNFVTGNAYTGENLITLMQTEFTNPNFMTYRQAQSIGRVVSKGQKGVTLKRIVTVTKKDKKGQMKQIRVPKFFTVFNLHQTEVLEA